MVRTHSENLEVVAKLQEKPDVFWDKEPSLPPPQQSDWASRQNGKCDSHTS